MSNERIFRLPEAQCNYVHVFEPRAGLGDTKQYDVMLVWDKEDHDKLADLRKRLKKAATERWGAKPRCKYALKDGDKLEDDDEDNDDSFASRMAGKYYLNCSSRYKPRIVDGKRRELTSDDEFYSGCMGIAAVHIYTTDHEQGGRRVSVGLDGIQRSARGERLGGIAIDPDEVFDEIEEADSDELEEEDDPLA